MPFRSAKQRAFLYAKHPDIAKRWTAEYGGAIVPGKKKAPTKKAGAKSRKARNRG